jgi:hypothetical protein
VHGTMKVADDSEGSLLVNPLPRPMPIHLMIT